MKKQDVIRAWRDGEFFANLDADSKANLPESPAALPTVDDSVLSSITGGCSFNEQFCPTSAICSPCPPRQCF